MSKKTRKFKTEVQQLLDLVIHSLYSKKEIFLRELISNASDAMDRLRFEALTDKALLADDEELRIKLTVDREQRTISIADNGIGMSAEEIDKSLGTIANSGTRNFLAALQEGKTSHDGEFIGQFGVGFYASFMVADKVSVLTRRAGADEQATLWTSAGDGSYALVEAEKETRGTEVTLHIREGMDEFLDEWRIRQTVKRYSDYIAYPVVMDVEREVEDPDRKDEKKKEVREETLNTMKAIWKRAKDEVSDEEYKDFYHHVCHDFGDPLRIVHYAAEGTTEFRALLYIPSMPPFDLYLREGHTGVHLYVRNVFITDSCKELLPDYLRFVKGVVDSSDLPLNVSREMLQDDVIIRRIQKSVVAKLMGELSDMKSADMDGYRAFFKSFGPVLKEGLHADFENHDKLKELVLYESTKTDDGQPVSLRDYVDRMQADQKDIYYITSDSLETAKRSPHLETFRHRDIEVLFFVDPIDEFVVQRLTEYDGHRLRAIDKGDIELPDAKDEKSEEERKASEKTFAPLLESVKKHLEDDIKDVRLSRRLTDSVACLVADEMGMNANMERLMRAMHQDVPKIKRVLELNPNHPLMARLNTMLEADKDSPRLADYIDLIYDQALLSEGSPVRDSVRFTKLIGEVMMAGAGA